MRVVLGGDGGELFLRGAEGLHVEPREACIDIHENAIWFGRFRSFRFRDPCAQISQTLRDFLAVAHIPAAVEGRKHQRAIVGIHLLGAHGQATIAIACPEEIHCQLEPCRGAGAGVFDIDHWNALNAHLAQRDLAPDHVLAFHMALHGVREERTVDTISRESSVRKCGCDSVARHVLDGFVPEFPEWRHPDAHNIYVLHRLSS